MTKAIKFIGITEITYYRWRQEYGGMSTSQAKWLKVLEQENSWLRSAVPDLPLEKHTLQGKALSLRRNSRSYSRIHLVSLHLATMDSKPDQLFVTSHRTVWLSLQGVKNFGSGVDAGD